MIKVKLLDYTPEPERVVAMAARLCYSASGAEELAEKLSEDKVKEMVRRMVSLGHGSTLEHASFTFGIEGVSRVLTHQLVRHRIASYDQQSQRYVAAQALLAEIRKTYDELTDMGVPKEDARYVLANAAETKILVTMNARSLMHFFNLRCCNRAQWEIREMAYKMLAEVKKVAPTLFHNAGASCVNTGRCPEGAMTCGKLQEMLKLRDSE